jgi:hypothetical protein
MAFQWRRHDRCEPGHLSLVGARSHRAITACAATTASVVSQVATLVVTTQAWQFRIGTAPRRPGPPSMPITLTAQGDENWSVSAGLTSNDCGFPLWPWVTAR